MFTLFRSAIFILMLAATPVPAMAEIRAVLVGVGDYLTLDADLKGPPNDVALMDQVLAGRGVQDRILLSTTTGLAPTRANIIAALADIAARAQPGDTVVFYFSGHGAQAPDASGDEGGGYDEIFLPADAAGWKGDIGAVENAILDDELQLWAQGLLSRGVKLVGLIDACHSDTGFRGKGRGVARGLSPAELGIPDGAASAPASPAADLTGDFVFLYSSQSDQRSFEYPLGNTGQWQGEFTLRLAEVLRTAPGASWAQVLQATAQTMQQGAAAQLPDGEGPMLHSAVFGAAQPARFAVQAGVVQAGLLQGLAAGDTLALYVDASGGDPVAQVVLGAVEARTAALAADAPPANWAERVFAAPPPAPTLTAPLRADPGDGQDYSEWLAALGPGQAAGDLVPILVAGGVALAGPDAVLDPFGAGSSPRVIVVADETKAEAVARMLDQAGYALRLHQVFNGLSGRSLTGTPALELDWARKPGQGCNAAGTSAPVDPAKGVQPCDQLWASFKNVSGADLDVSALYFNADFSITPLWPRQGLSNRLAAGESASFGLQIDAASPPALEQIVLLAVPVAPGAARVDLTSLAEPGQARGDGAAGWISGQLNAETTQRGFSVKPPALMMIEQTVRVLPAP